MTAGQRCSGMCDLLFEKTKRGRRGASPTQNTNRNKRGKTKNGPKKVYLWNRSLILRAIFSLLVCHLGIACSSVVALKGCQNR